jgi:hypothetical protein
MMHRLTTTLMAATMAVMIAGCGSEQPAGSKPPAATAPALPAGLILDTPPADAQPLAAVRPGAKAGDTITFTGYIGGRAKPFTEGRAVFVVADLVAAPPCTDGCPVPWDACCTDPDAIKANSATVQIVDAAGQPLRLTLSGVAGLTAGAEVTVTGTVREAGEGYLLVDAGGIAVKRHAAQ